MFKLTPSELWGEITELDRFERWWSWLSDLELSPPGDLAEGSILTFAIVSPLPYRMNCRVEFTKVIPEELIETRVTGDLQGWANLELAAIDPGAIVVLSWELEPTQTPLRILVRAARPLIVRTKDWAIDIALGAFRRNVEHR